jgi:hypothetical protein
VVEWKGGDQAGWQEIRKLPQRHPSRRFCVGVESFLAHVTPRDVMKSSGTGSDLIKTSGACQPVDVTFWRHNAFNRNQPLGIQRQVTEAEFDRIFELSAVTSSVAA